MADLNFPKDRTELDPAGTGPLQTGDEYTANGTTWVYDATVGAWGSGASGESLSDLYISKVINDSAAGKITFEDTSIHENGIQVLKGGSGDSEKIYSKFGYDLYLGQNNASHPGGGAVVSIHPTINSSGGASMLALTGNDLTAATGASGYLFQVTSFNGSIGDDLNAFSCNDISDTADGLNIGYKGSVREGVEGKNYNAYFAAKTGTTAPIYSKGNVEVVGDVKLSSITSANFLGTDSDGNIVASTAGDGLYLSKVNDDTAAGEITFDKRDVHKKGLAIKEDSTGKDAIFTIQGNSLRLTSSTTAGNLISAAIDYGSNTAFNVNKKTVADGSTLTSQSAIVSTFDASNITIGGGNINSYFPPQSIASRLEYDGNTTVNTFSHFNVQSNRNPDLSGTGTPPAELTYYMAHSASIGINDPDGNTETSFDNSNVYAFRTTFNDGQAKNVFGLYSSGTAPSFHQGDFLVGGTPSLNTYELWKSTLTSLQLDELENGTLVAPANVSLPGDGEFARQWWYDQQSAEDQALIDSGELEYPEHLAAVTFTDTFDLGANTKINLHGAVDSNGAIASFIGGNVGIGTKTPDYKLTVSEGNAASIAIKTRGDNTVPRASRLIFGHNDGDSVGISCTRQSGQTFDTANLSFRVGGIENEQQKMLITSSGNVGIGTTLNVEPAAKLEVVGDALFSDKTTHNNGVEVSGGGTVVNGVVSVGTNKVALSSNNADVLLIAQAEQASAVRLEVKDNVTGNPNGSSCYGLQLLHPNTLSTSRPDQVYIGVSSGVSITSPVSSAHSFFGDCNGSTGVTNYASVYLANADADGNKRFNFFAKGDAPSYYKGDVRVNNQNFNEPGQENTQTGACINSVSDGATVYASRESNLAMCFNRNSSGIVGQYRMNGAVRGEVVVSSGGCNWNTKTFFSTRDEVPEFTNASQIISQLKAGRDGFASEDIQAHMPTDWVSQSDGQVMFDNTRIIPVLTKALQEALTKIETLETRLSDAGIA